MSILIKDMEMPKEGFVEILIRDDGTVQQTGQSYRIDGTDYYTPYVGEMPVMYKAVPVTEPHGRLIDADALEDSFEPSDFWNPDAEDNCFAAVRIVHSAPTIIPASEEEM